MKETLLYLLKQLVDHPDEVTVEEASAETKTTLTIHAHPEDIGKIIGRGGRIIRALRDLVKLIATKHNTYVEVILASEA